MGGSQSSRKITVDNDSAIQVSQEALDRIQKQLAAKKPEPQQQPVYYPPPPYYESKQKQKELEAEEAYWAKRIDNLKRAHEKINSSMQTEYVKTLNEADALFKTAQNDKIVTKTPPCQEQKEKVLQCYDSNPDKSLLCSMLVSEFNNCVCNSRISVLSASS